MKNIKAGSNNTTIIHPNKIQEDKEMVNWLLLLYKQLISGVLSDLKILRERKMKIVSLHITHYTLLLHIFLPTFHATLEMMAL